MKRAGRGDETPFDGPWFRRGLLVVVLAALALFPLSALAIGIFVDSDEVAAWLRPRLSGALNREVTFGDAGISILPRPGLRLSDVRIGGSSESDLTSIAAVRDVHLDASLPALFTGRVNVGRIRLSGLDVNLAISEDGTSNFGDLVPESEVVEVAKRAPVSFGITEVEVDDANLTYFDGVHDRSFAIGGGSASLGVTVQPDGGWVVVANVTGDSLHVRVPALTEEIIRADAPTVELTLRGDHALESIEVEEGRIEEWGQTLRVTGRIDGLADVDPSVDLRFENPALDFGAVTSLLPRDMRASRLPALEGSLDMGLRLRGSLREEGSPVWSGTIRLTDVGIRLGGAPLLSDVDGVIGVRGASIRVDSVSGRLADGPFELSGALDRGTRRVVASFEGSPDLDALDRLGLAPSGTTLAGEAEMTLAISGPLSAPDSLAITGGVQVSGVQVEQEGLGVPLYLPSADLTLTDAGVQWSGVTVLVGSDPLTTSGRVGGPVASWWLGDVVPEIDGSLTGERLDLEAMLPADDGAPEVTYARIAFAHLGGREIEGRTPKELADRAGFARPADLPLHGSLEVGLDELRYRSHDLRGVSARLLVSDSSLTVDDAVFDAFGGSVRARLDLGTGRRFDEPFELTLATEDVDAGAFLSQMTPFGDAVSGRLDVDFDVTGTVDDSLMPLLESLEASGTLAVHDGVVAGTGINLALADFLAMDDWTSMPFSAWETEFGILDGMFEVDESRLDSDLATATLSGVVGMGGALDLAMALSIPPQHLEAVSLRRTGVAQTVLDRLREADSPLDLGIRISGTVEGPTLEPDALAASERLAGSGR